MPIDDQDPLTLFGEKSDSPNQKCPRCDGSLRESEVKEAIQLGDGRSVSARIPVLACENCDFQISGSGADEIRDAAVRVHLGLLTASEVKEVRTNLGFSRREFSEAFGIPMASMERWENGRLIQNKTADTLLRVLRNKGTASAVDRRRTNNVSGCNVKNLEVFRTINRSERLIDEVRNRATKFCLRRM